MSIRTDPWQIHAALDPASTASRMIVPEGFRVETIVSEPDIVQPIAYTIDDRGRLWVLENSNYPESPGKATDPDHCLRRCGWRWEIRKAQHLFA